jgi:predicted DNA-binding transcriptional regulator AlpA
MERHTLSPDRQRPVLWLKDLAERWGVSEVTLWRWRNKGRIPQPTIQIGIRSGWAVGVIEAFEQGRLQ